MKKLLTVMALATMTVAASAQLRSGIDLKDLDTSVRPADDFYEYACGGWMKANPLPAAYSRYGSFDRLAEDNNKRINGILKELLENSYSQGSVEQKLSDLYKLAMDSARREKEGVAPLMGELKTLENAKNKEQLFNVQLSMMPYGESEFFSAYIGADDKNASENILNIYQSGIGFKKGAAEKKMKNILKIETALAKVSKSRTELRDPIANYHKMTLKEFDAKYPHFQLEKQMNAKGIKTEYIQEMVVGQPEFMAAADKIFAEMTAAEYRDVMEWGLIGSSTGYLNDAVRAENFEFYGKVFSGRQQDHPLWRRATNQVQGVMGEALGRIYVKKYFPASSKERMKTLVENLRIALGERIAAQDWMDDSTKVNALLKLNTFYVKIGYPDKWTDISGLKIDAKKSYYENMKECARFWTAWRINHTAGKPVDRDDWHMTPQTVNAYYNPTTNEICFPAGILQVPFFDATADDAFNYGAIGVVIGHEMTHGFDDQGRRFDKDGNMHDWWTAEDGKNFTLRTDKYADFFSKIKVLPDLNANGRLTLGENLADHGGLQVAWYAYKNATKRNPLPVIDGLTADQRFFLAYAGVWAGNITEAEIRNRTKSDPHSLGRYRVNGALPHIDMWYDAFGVKEGDKMFVPKSERLPLW